MPDTETKTRTKREPAAIAAAELEAATKRVEAARKRQTTAEAEVEKAKADVTRLQRLADYAAQNPDLPENQKIRPADEDDAPGIESDLN